MKKSQLCINSQWQSKDQEDGSAIQKDPTFAIVADEMSDTMSPFQNRSRIEDCTFNQKEDEIVNARLMTTDVIDRMERERSDVRMRQERMKLETTSAILILSSVMSTNLLFTDDGYQTQRS